jgi:hypothetical protein
MNCLPCLKPFLFKHFFVGGYHIVNTSARFSAAFKIWVVFGYDTHDIIDFIYGICQSTCD